MTKKLVTLKLEGDLNTTGFHVLLEIGPEGARPDSEAIGSLPANPALLQQLSAVRHPIAYPPDRDNLCWFITYG